MSSENRLPSIFVLDTNVIMHDPSCLFNFEEHDVFIPTSVLVEMDAHKKGMTENARNVRQASRFIIDLFDKSKGDLNGGLSLDKSEIKGATGKLLFETNDALSVPPGSLDLKKTDNVIIAVTMELQKKYPERPVVLVTKDINMRIMAAIHGVRSEDYTNDKVLEDADLAYTGVRRLTRDEYKRLLSSSRACRKEHLHTSYVVAGAMARSLIVNQFLVCPADKGEYDIYMVESKDGSSATIRTITDYTKEKYPVWGVHAKNMEQSIALNLLMDENIHLVTILGQAGTGKTLLTVAAGLTQILNKPIYNNIVMTRAMVPIGDDIGFLPGTEEEKTAPWMGALWDNLEFLATTHSETKPRGERGEKSDPIKDRIQVRSLTFMRGRTFMKRYLILDEAQNLTPKQMKTLITRAGPGTKVVCLGNLSQIDTPYLTEATSGLAHVVALSKGWEHYGHITLVQGERSPLADFGNKVL